MTPEPHRNTIIKLFRRIGEQPDLTAVWSAMPNAERNSMAGAFYNILKEHDTAIRKEERERVLKDIEDYIHVGEKTCDKLEPIDRGYLLCCADIQRHIKMLRGET